MTEMTEPTRETRTPAARWRARVDFSSVRVRAAAGVGALIAVAGIVIAVVVSGNSGSGVHPIAPIELSASGLRTLARNVPQSIYWVGPRKGYLYELTRLSNGNVAIRYLPDGVQAGSPGSQFLSVTTVPQPGAFRKLKESSKGKWVSTSGGGIAVVDTSHPTNVGVAYPGESYQIELYDPSPSKARTFAVSGAVRPVVG
jgi:hypothetical protein